MAYATRLPRRDATRLPRREPTVQLCTDPELRIRPQFKLPDWLLLASWSFGGLFSSFPTKGKGKSHGSRPPSTNVAAKKTCKCLDCGKYGHWKGDSECKDVKGGKRKSFRPHGANVITQNFRLDADGEDEDDHDQDLRGAIRKCLNEVHGASTEEQMCVITSLISASSTDPNGSQHQFMDKATRATETSTSPPERWRRAGKARP